jgi:predicted DNA-binding protein (UPF0251 family)
MKRLITEKQEKALRLCHQDFEGLNQTEAAKRMNISQSALSDLLTKVREILPQYFPLLTKLEVKCYHYFAIEGQSVDEIAKYMDKSQDTIYKALQRVKIKGAWSPKSKGRALQYDPSMDANVKHKF